jgi:O-succinylbenzoic acid--CoA ligase
MITLSNTQHWLIEQTIKQSNNQAIIASGKTLTYQELLSECLTTANYLFSLGIKEGDCVGILFKHSYEFFVIVNALWFIGSIPVPLNTRNTNEEIQNQLHQADIKFLIIDETLQSQFASLIFQNKTYLNEVTKYELRSTKFNPQHSTFHILNSALILFTSGSAGKPKAVVHTFNSLLESVKATDSFADLTPNDIWLASLPLYHIGGLMILVRSLVAGSLVIFPVSLKFEEIKQSNPTHVSLVSTTLQKFLTEKVYPNKNLKYIFLGGGPSEGKLTLDAIEHGLPIVKVYGSTETCSMVTALLPKEIKSKPDSVGKALGTNKIKIMNKSKNDSDNFCGSGEVGEIVVSAQALFKKYYNDQLTTDKVLKNGWYHTGDYGWLDDEGYLYIESRREDLIITGGENVSTNEVETAIKSHHLIDDAFVFALQDETWGQIICAAVASKKLSEEELRNFLREKIAGYKIPKRFFFIENIPKNEMGKVIRSELLKQFNLS